MVKEYVREMYVPAISNLEGAKELGD